MVNKMDLTTLKEWMARIACLVLLMVSVSVAEASHFRFGHFTYKARPDISPTTADFRMTVAFRSSYFGHPKIGQTFRPGRYSFGDGYSSNHTYRVIARNLQEDWIVGEAIDTRNENNLVRHTYRAANNNGQPWIGNFSSCCKIGGLRNSGSTWRVYTRVNLENGNSSPFSNLPPIVSCSKYDCRFLIPAVDPDGDQLTWRMSTRSESAINSIPSGMKVDRDTGLFTWDGAESFSNGLYTIQVTIEDRDEEGNVKSSAAIDFLLNLRDQGTNASPEFDHPPTPEAGSVIKAVVGQKLTLTVQASDSDPNDQVYLNHVGLPVGATFEQSVSGGTTGVATLEWTPTTADMGEHLVTFLANDNRGGASAPVSVRIEVIKPAISDVKIVSTLSTAGIGIESGSYSVAPSLIEVENDRTIVTWEFDTFSVGQLENLTTELKLFNVEPGSQRVVTEQLAISYTDIDGNPVHETLGEQSVKVAPSLTTLDVDTDKDVYSPAESVVISGVLGNLSEIETDAQVVVTIEDNQQARVANLGIFDVQAIAPKGQAAIPDQLFNTAGIYAGTYQVVGQLLGNDGQVLTQSVAPFAMTTAGGAFAEVGALVTTDKPVYQAWDQARIDLRVSNVSNNGLFDGGVGTLQVSRPNGKLLAEQTYNLNSLPPQGSTDRQYALPLVDREAGRYRVSWIVRQDGEILATSQASFRVERSELMSLTGNVTVEYYDTGEAKTCHFEITNRSAQAEVKANLIYQLVSLADGSVISQIRQNDTPVSNTIAHPYQLLLSDPPAYGGYGCILMAEADGELLELAAAGFEVVPPTVMVDLHPAAKGKLLVLVDDLATATSDLNDAGRQRTYLEDLLTRHQWHYTLTDSARDFTAEFNSGLYSAEAMFSEQVTLAPQTEQLLVEAQHNGLGLLVSGSWNRRNNHVEKALGVKLTGRNNQAGSISDNGYLEQSVAVDALVTQGLALAHCDADVWAVFGGGKNASDDCAYAPAPAAVTLGVYGSGANSYFAYDVLDLATSWQGLHEQLLLEALLAIQPQVWPVAAGRVIPVEIRLENLSRKAAVDIRFTLPQGGTILESELPTTFADDTWLWQRDFASPGDTSNVLFIQLPDGVTGEVTLQVDIDAGINRSLMVDDSELNFSLGAIDGRHKHQQVSTMVQQLMAQGPGIANYRFIAKKLDHAQGHLNKAKVDNAVKSILLATDEIAQESYPTAVELRFLLDFWLYQLQRQL